MYAAINDLEAKRFVCVDRGFIVYKRIGCHLTAALRAGPVLGGAEEFFVHSLTSEHLMNEPAFYEAHGPNWLASVRMRAEPGFQKSNQCAVLTGRNEGRSWQRTHRLAIEC